MKSLVLLSTLLAVAAADKPAPTFSQASAAAAPTAGNTYAAAQAPSKEAYSSPQQVAEEPVAPSTQGFYYYYYPVGSTYSGGESKVNYQGNAPVASPVAAAPGGGSLLGGSSSLLLGGGLAALVSVAAIALFASGGIGRRSLSETISSVDLDSVAYYVSQGIRIWTDLQAK